MKSVITVCIYIYVNQSYLGILCSMCAFRGLGYHWKSSVFVGSSSDFPAMKFLLLQQQPIYALLMCLGSLLYLLVGGFKHEFSSPFHIWDN